MVPQLTNVMSRETSSLNGKWHYIVDVQEEGYYDYRMKPTRWGFFNNAKPQRPEDLIEYDFDAAPTMTIPGDWNTQDETLFFYEGMVWFKYSFPAQVPVEDFRSPRRVLTGIQNYYNMKGLVSDEGERKKAWYVLKKWYEGK